MAGKQSSPTNLPAPLRTAASVLGRVPGAGVVNRAAEGALDKVGAVSPRGRRLAVYTGAGVLGVAGVVEWPVALTGAAVAWLTQARPEERERTEAGPPAGELGEMRAGEEREVTAADVSATPSADGGVQPGGTPIATEPPITVTEHPTPGPAPTAPDELAPPPGPGPVSTTETEEPAGQAPAGTAGAEAAGQGPASTTGADAPAGEGLAGTADTGAPVGQSQAGTVGTEAPAGQGLAGTADTGAPAGRGVAGSAGTGALAGEGPAGTADTGAPAGQRPAGTVGTEAPVGRGPASAAGAGAPAVAEGPSARHR